MRWIAVVMVMAGCAGRPLEPGASDDALPVNTSDLGRMDARDDGGACTVPNAEVTAAAVKIAWVALDGSGATPRVSWSCDCIERNGIWCDLYRDGDPLTVTWFERMDGARVIHPARISESQLAYVLADHANLIDAYAAGVAVSRVLAAAGY